MAERLLSLILLFLAAVPGAAVAASGGGVLLKAHNDVGNTASLQRGARNFVNYCLGCHSARYVRYNRVGEDLDLTESQVIDNLMFTGDKPFEPMTIAMSPSDGARWFGRTPPDLSLIARSRGTDWLYTYLMGFYLDESVPQGVNNVALPGASMPHVLWELQGLQRAVFHEYTGDDGTVHKDFEGFEAVTDGLLTPDEYDQFVTDLVNFLDYIAEPVKLKRQALGIKVLGFLLVFILFSYALKKEFWKDVH